MRKLSFYPRLALGNLWRNRSTYLPYLLACVVSVFTFYTMLAMNMNGALNGLRGESVVTSFTAIGTVILGIFCSVLIFYTNSFLIKRRKKEIGLYAVLGMEKGNIGMVLFFETLFTAAIALVAGLLLGMLLSRLLFLVLLRMIRFEVTLSMPVMPQALAITAAFFAVVFLLALLSNLRQVRRTDPVQLMAGAKQGEREPKASWVLTAVGLLCLAGGYFIALYFKSPLEAIMLFLVAAFLVIIGTYCLFTSGSIALLKLLRKNKGYYYQPNHFISVSGMIYRMKQNATGLATICILSCMVLVTVSATVSLNVGAEDSLKVQYPYEYDMVFNNYDDGETLLAGGRKIAQDSGVEIVNLQDYRRLSIVTKQNGTDFVESIDDSDLSAMTVFGLVPLEDYRKSEGPLVNPLRVNEVLAFTTGGTYDADTLTLNGITYKLRHLDELGGVKAGQMDIGKTITLVLPDMAAMDAAAAARPASADGTYPESRYRRSVAFDLEGTEEGKAAFLAAYQQYVGELSTNETFQFRPRDEGKEGWYASNGGFLFLGIYFGVLFMLAAVLIIYYKQVSEGYDDAGRFEILQQVGMSEYEVKKTINGQILTVFFLPLVVAVIHIVVAFFPVSRAMVLFGVVNTPLLVLATALTVLAYALVYMLVYRRTAKTYFRLVRRESATA